MAVPDDLSNQVPPNGDPAARHVVNPGMVGRLKRWVRIAFGFILITIGALFGLVPLVPGWPLGIFGLSILAAEFVWARRLLKKLRVQGVRLRDALFPPKRPKKPKRARVPPIA